MVDKGWTTRQWNLQVFGEGEVTSRYSMRVMNDKCNTESTFVLCVKVTRLRTPKKVG